MSDERLKAWLSFIKFLLGTMILGLITLSIKSSLQQREIEIKEQEQVGKFLNHALQQDVGVRRRFAQYFSTVSRSPDIRDRWKEYLLVLNIEYKSTIEEKSRLEKLSRKNNLDEKERDAILQEIDALKEAIRPNRFSGMGEGIYPGRYYGQGYQNGYFENLNPQYSEPRY